MEKIASFTVDHLRLPPGIYLSRQDGDIATYDLRFRRPNADEPLGNASLHTIEHLGATYARSAALADRVVYFGPMGCRTGFYLLLRGVSHADALELIKETVRFTADYEGEVPGAAAAECGNWREHDLAKARKDAAAYYEIIRDWTPDKLIYPN